MRKHSRSSKHGGFKEVFLNPNDKGSGNHAQGAFRGRTVLNLSSKLGSYHQKLSFLIEIFYIQDFYWDFSIMKNFAKKFKFSPKISVFTFLSDNLSIFDQKRGFRGYLKCCWSKTINVLNISWVPSWVEMSLVVKAWLIFATCGWILVNCW